MKGFILPAVLVVFLCITVFPLAAAAPEASFIMHQSENAKTSAHDFSNGTHLAQYSYFISIQNMDDDSDTVLGNITYALDADNIIGYSQKGFAKRTGSFIRWTFPSNNALPEYTYNRSTAETGYIYPRYFPMTIHRWANRSVFSSDGYQRAYFSLSYDNFSMDETAFTVNNVWGEISAYGNPNVSVSLLPDTFTTNMPVRDNPMASVDNHSYSFSNYTYRLETNHIYNFSVVIHVHLTNPSGPPVEYYPGFSTGLSGGEITQDPVSRFRATQPPDLLPEHAHAANGSTNVSNIWTYSLQYFRTGGLNESIVQVVAAPPVANFTATPRSGTAPLTVRFTDASRNSPASWNWSFGDGSAINSTRRSPVHTFTRPGTYTVSLNVSNPFGFNRMTKTRYITVTSPITLTAPNGGENWRNGTTHPIRWTYSGDPGSLVDILLVNGSASHPVYTFIRTSVPIGSAGSGSYAWKIPFNQVIGSDYSVFIRSRSNPVLSDASNAQFTISAGTPITVTVPNGGQTWAPGSTQIIRWSYTGNPGSQVRIDLLKGGTFSRVIALNYPVGTGGAGSRSWIVPSDQAPGTDYRIRVTSLQNSLWNDTSNADFSISA